MPDQDVVITGLVETQRMIVEYPGELTRSGLAAALVAGSSVIQSALKDNAPREERIPGKQYEFAPLLDSLVTDIQVNQTAMFGIAETGFGDAGPVALWDEYGHRIVTHSGRDTGISTQPNPFMRRTTDQCADAAIDAFCNSLLGTLRKQYGL